MPHLRRIDKKIIQPRYLVVRAVKPAAKRRKDDGKPMAKLRKSDLPHLQADTEDFIDQAVDSRKSIKRAGRKCAITVSIDPTVLGKAG